MCTCKWSLECFFLSFTLEKKQKILEKNRLQVQQLREEAEKFEKHWKRVQSDQVNECRESMKKQQEHWNLQQRRASDRPMSAAANYSARSEEWNATSSSIHGRSSSPQSGTANGCKSAASSKELLFEPVDGKRGFEMGYENNNMKQTTVIESASNNNTAIGSNIKQEYSSESHDQVRFKRSSSDCNGSSVSLSDSSGVVRSSSSKVKAVRFDIPLNER